jgi:hypothetical protein
VLGRGVGDPDIESRKGRADDLARELALGPGNPQRPPAPKKPRKPLPRS